MWGEVLLRLRLRLRRTQALHIDDAVMRDRYRLYTRLV